jgi:hypothetical protein
MFLEAHMNIKRFDAFIDEQLDDIGLLDFHRFVTCFEWSQRIPPHSPAKRV